MDSTLLPLTHSLAPDTVICAESSRSNGEKNSAHTTPTTAAMDTMVIATRLTTISVLTCRRSLTRALKSTTFGRAATPNGPVLSLSVLATKSSLCNALASTNPVALDAPVPDTPVPDVPVPDTPPTETLLPRRVGLTRSEPLPCSPPSADLFSLLRFAELATRPCFRVPPFLEAASESAFLRLFRDTIARNDRLRRLAAGSAALLALLDLPASPALSDDDGRRSGTVARPDTTERPDDPRSEAARPEAALRDTGLDEFASLAPPYDIPGMAGPGTLRDCLATRGKVPLDDIRASRDTLSDGILFPDAAFPDAILLAAAFPVTLLDAAVSAPDPARPAPG